MTQTISGQCVRRLRESSQGTTIQVRKAHFKAMDHRHYRVRANMRHLRRWYRYSVFYVSAAAVMLVCGCCKTSIRNDGDRPLLQSSTRPAHEESVVPLLLRLDSWGNLIDRRGHSINQDDLNKCMQRLSAQSSIHIELVVEEGFEDKVTMRQLARAIDRVSNAVGFVGSSAVGKLRVLVKMPEGSERGRHVTLTAGSL